VKDKGKDVITVMVC